MIKIGNRVFIPLKVAANRVGYSVDWVRNCSHQYNFPKRVYLSSRRSGFWLAEIDRWLERRAKLSRKTGQSLKRTHRAEIRAA